MRVFCIFNSKFDLSIPVVVSFVDSFTDQHEESWVRYAELMALLSIFKGTVDMN